MQQYEVFCKKPGIFTDSFVILTFSPERAAEEFARLFLTRYVGPMKGDYFEVIVVDENKNKHELSVNIKISREIEIDVNEIDE